MERTGKITSFMTLAVAFCLVVVPLAQPEEKTKSLKRLDHEAKPRVALYEEYDEKLSIPQSAEITGEAREELNLVGIASVDGVYRAVVNDEIVKVGSVIKGYEVLGICRQGIIVEYDGYWVWIQLGKGPAGSGYD